MVALEPSVRMLMKNRVEDENGQTTALLQTKNGQKLLRGTWIDMHDKAVSFNTRKYHTLEEHRGNMWALAAFTSQETGSQISHRGTNGTRLSRSTALKVCSSLSAR